MTPFAPAVTILFDRIVAAVGETNVDETILARHCADLSAQCSPAYDVFKPVLQLDPDIRHAICAKLADLVELVISEELRVPANIERTSELLVNVPGIAPEEAAASWYASVRAAHSRKGMHIVLQEFGAWLEAVPAETRAAFAKLLPRLSAQAGHLGISGMNTIISAINKVQAPHCPSLFALLQDYGECGHNILIHVARIGSSMTHLAPSGYLARFGRAVPPTVAASDSDGRKLVATLAGLIESHNGGDSERSRAIVELVLAVAERNVSSACFVAQVIAKQAKETSSEVFDAWLADFATLVDGIGIRIVSFGTKHLPRLYARLDRDAVRAFVEHAASAGKQFGVTAGEQFCTERTPTACSLTERPARPAKS